MKTSVRIVLAVAASIFLAGCYSFPSRHGQWAGTVTYEHLRTYEGEEQDCANLAFDAPPEMKGHKPKEALLVDANGYCYTPNQVPSSRLHVQGYLYAGFPRSQQRGKPLFTVTQGATNDMQLWWLLEVKNIELLY